MCRLCCNYERKTYIVHTVSGMNAKRYFTAFRFPLLFIFIIMIGIIGRKIGMAQTFSEKGKAVPVTYIQCGQNTVYDIKTQDRDGYSAVVLGFEPLEKRATKTKKYSTMREFKGEVSGIEKGNSVDVSIFESGEKVSLVGRSKGKGFQGRVRKHNARVARKTHGTKYIRHGSTGSACITGRSQKGLKMAGRMGNDQVTLHKREIVTVDAGRGLVAIKGGVPGAINSVVFLKKA